MRKAILIGVAILAGCARLPSGEDLQAFSVASTKGVNVVKTAVASAEVIAGRYEVELQAQAYVLGRPTSAITVPRKQTRLSPEAISAMLGALADLAVYTEAIGVAADQKNVDELEAAAQNLGKAAGNLATLSPAPGAQVAGAALAVGGRLLGYGLADRYSRKIVGIIAENDATVARLVDLLAFDMGWLLGDVDFQVGDYENERERSMRIIRQDTRITRAGFYHEFYAARADIAANQALFDAVSNGQELLEKIKTTHQKLAVGDSDVKLAIARFGASADDLAALITAIRKESGQ